MHSSHLRKQPKSWETTFVVSKVAHLFFFCLHPEQIPVGENGTSDVVMG